MTNHLWQSTLFALAAGLLALALRKNRASVRYCVWLSASVKFFVPLSLLIGLGSYFQRTPMVVAAPVVSRAIVQAAEPFPETVSFAPVAARTHDWVAMSMIGVWVCGFACVALMRLRGWLRIRAAVRGSHASDVGGPIAASVEVRDAPGLLEPGVFGFVRPVLLLPEGIEKYLSASQLDAVLAHEVSHVRRRDNLTSAVHMVVEGVFWFHPFVWWIGSRMVEERELACDEEVVRLGGEPEVYAEAILNVCKLYVESPLVCVAGVTGADLKKRIEAIMNGCVSIRLSAAKKVVLAGAAVVALVTPVFIGRLRAQTAVPKFEVASIRACKAGEPPPGGGASKGGRGGGGSSASSPDRLTFPCLPARLFITMAYITFADGKYNSQPDLRLEGGPEWLGSDFSSERYSINAKAEGTPGQLMMRGPMLQALLEDRFKLKVHRETRETPLYALTVAKGGLKLRRSEDGSCTPRDRSQYPPQPLEAGETPCGIGVMMSRATGIPRITGTGATMAELARILGNSGRPVLDKTGVPGRFDFELRFVPNGAEPSADADAPSVFTALQEVGLKLEPIKGPRDFLVIDHVERPSEN